MRRKYERKSKGFTEKITKNYDRTDPKYDWLKYFRVARYWVKRNYGLKLEDLEMLLFLYGQHLFKRSDFNEYQQIFSWDVNRFDRLNRMGWIHIWRQRRITEAALYEVTRKTRVMITQFYKILSAEVTISENDKHNIIFKKNSPYTDKVYRRVIKRMNSEIKERQLHLSRE